MGRSCDIFYSHPNILLKDHLRGVSDLCASYIENSINNMKIIEVAELIGKGHDLAKYTEFFQKHLNGEKVKGQLFTHSKLSAILTAWIVNKRTSDSFLTTVSFLCVYSHHGFLEDFDKFQTIAWTIDEPLIMEQIKSIKKRLNLIRSEFEELGLPDLEEFFNDPIKNINVVKEILEDSDIIFTEYQNIWAAYFIILLLYSSLIDADRKDASRIYDSIKHDRPFKDISAKIVTLYREKKFSASERQIDEIRETIFGLCEKTLKNVLTRNSLPRIITITAPTGSGKTILGLYTALKLREFFSMNGRTPRIIYSLPFINIIEQTYSVFKDILSHQFKEVPVNLLLKHHHLAFPENRREDIPVDKMLLLTDAWDSEIVITTFEQLIRSIIGNRGSLLRKFHNLSGSILILDEIQAIPLEYWKLIQEVLMKLAVTLNVRIIMMTATRPIIFQGEMELVPNHREFFKRLNRVTIISVIDNEMNPEKFVGFFFSKWDKDLSALIVLNTIKTSKTVYRRICERLKDESVRLGSEKELEMVNDPSKIAIAFLSTSIVPEERKRRINLIKTLLKNGRRVILVSTQVVEAGVDLDFDTAFRDLGPLDSIIQVAGRCNRNWRHKDVSRVYIVRIIDDNEKPEAEKIYGSVLPHITINILRKKPIIDEREILEVIDEYYTEVVSRCNIDSEFLTHIKNLAYDNLSNFSLIKEESKVSIFIELNEDAKRVVNRFKSVLNEFHSVNRDDVFKWKARLRELRAELENYIVNVWPSDKIRSLEEIVPGVGIRFASKNVLPAYYDKETGFIAEDESGDYIW